MEEPGTAPSPKGNDFLPPVVLAEKTFVHLLHHVGQHRAGIISKIQVPDLRHGHGDDGKSFFVFFGGARAQLGSNGEEASHRQGNAKHVPTIRHPSQAGSQRSSLYPSDGLGWALGYWGGL